MNTRLARTLLLTTLTTLCAFQLAWGATNKKKEMDYGNAKIPAKPLIVEEDIAFEDTSVHDSTTDFMAAKRKPSSNGKDYPTADMMSPALVDFQNRLMAAKD